MIDRIENFTKKSFKNYTFPEELRFKEKNIIFGLNGRGKSSLSEGIYEKHVESKNEESVRYFNGKYLENDLILIDSSGIKGVKLTLGKKFVEIENKINDIKSKIHDTDKIKDQKDNLENEAIELIEKVHEDKKGKLRITKKTKKDGFQKICELYENDLNKAMRIEPNIEKLKKYSGTDNQFTSKIEKIYNLGNMNNNIKIEKTEIYEKINNYMNRSYDNNNIPESKIINWLEDGEKLHKDHSKCLFCGNDININKIKEKIKEYVDDEKQKDKNFLENYIIQQNDNVVEISKLELLAKDYHRVLGEKKEELFEFDEEKLIIKEHIDKIYTKVLDMECSYEEIDDLLVIDAYNTIQAKIKELENLKKEELEKTIEKENKYTDLVKGSIAIGVKDILEKTDILSKIDNISEELLIKLKENEDYNLEIKELEAEKSDISEFKNLINEVLESIGVNFYLAPSDDGKNYVIKHKEKQQLSAKDISEGEKNILALLFFYFELFLDKEQEKLKDEIELIILDDPINSLDQTNKFYVIEILRQILLLKKVQVFILTHSWDDYCNLTYGFKSKEIEYFEVYKNNSNESEIRLLKKGINPYKKLFKDINDLSEKKIDDINDNDLYYSVNAMRRIFEEFLRFKGSSKIMAQKSCQKEIENIYYCATNEYLSSNMKIKLGSFLICINVLSHQPYRSTEVLENAKFLMKFIKKCDNAHHSAMIN